MIFDSLVRLRNHCKTKYDGKLGYYNKCFFSSIVSKAECKKKGEKLSCSAQNLLGLCIKMFFLFFFKMDVVIALNKTSNSTVVWSES